MPPERPASEWVTAAEAGRRIGKAPGTVYSWATRYHARKLKRGGATYFHLADLRVIEREIFHSHAIPETWQERARIADSCPLREAEREAERAFQAA